MFSTIVVLLQLTISAIIAYCLIAQMRAGSAQGTTHHKRSYTREMEQLRAMRAVRLNLPLNEAIRPAAFDQIVGQERGLRALSAILSSPNPQHIIIYGPPGVGKTCAARVALEEAKKSGASPFRRDAPFIEVDATTMRFDERAIADPLIGSVHDPIYQGAGALGVAGVPQPKPGAVSKAHGGILFIDEIGELHPAQMNKLLKVLEDRRVLFESAYYDPEDPATPAYIHDIFKNGLPADFRLIGATTRSPDSLPPALRSRCMELYFNPLLPQHLMTIAKNAAQRAGFDAQEGVAEMICAHSQGGRDAANLTQIAIGFAQAQGRKQLLLDDVREVIRCGNYLPRQMRKILPEPRVGCVNALAVAGPGMGMVLWVQASAQKGTGKFTVTGIIDEETMDGGGKSAHRISQAGCSVRNVQTALRHLGADLSGVDIHVDFPGGIPVDGPSAGVAMAIAVLSALCGRAPDNTLAITGELSIGGQAMPVGGIFDKAEAAARAGAAAVLVPAENIAEAEGAAIPAIAYETLEQAAGHLLPGEPFLFSGAGLPQPVPESPAAVACASAQEAPLPANTPVSQAQPL